MDDRPWRLACLSELERKVLWLSTWMVHHANHVRPRRDDLKVGGHQASSASVVTLLTALFLHVLRPEDRVAVKPHASPVFHAIQYLLGHQSLDQLQRFRAFGGAQAYPSRTKDRDDVDFSTGSVGLGVGLTLFASLVQDYVRLNGLATEALPAGRVVAVLGDGELDEGNVFEALLEGWKHDVRNLWWVVDYNRHSLDGVVAEGLFGRVVRLFEAMDWRVVTLKYGRRLEAAFAEPGGAALREWIDACPNPVYSALTFKGGAAWRERLTRDLGHRPGIAGLLARHDDDALHALMTNLGGHDLESLVAAFEAVTDDVPTCFVAYTIKGYGLPLAGHRDNHAGLLTPAQMADVKRAMGLADGEEWDPRAGLGVPAAELDRFLRSVPFAQRFPRRFDPPPVKVPPLFPRPGGAAGSTQAAFGRMLFDLAAGDSELAGRIVTASPDVTVSTNLGGWVNRRGLFSRRPGQDVFREERIASPQAWVPGPRGQHVELGIAEHNLFLCLAALGLAAPLFGARLLPIGTLYDPFIKRGLDALVYACYQDARFIVVGTPSGVTLAPEGGAHQSVVTPLVGLGLDRLEYFEPAFVDELAVVLRWAFEHLQAPDGASVYLRLSTRQVAQPERDVDEALETAILEGGYWLVPPDAATEVALVFTGAVAPDVLAAHGAIADEARAAVLAVTSPDRLHRGWLRAGAAPRSGRDSAGPAVERLLAAVPPDARLVTVLDGHPATLSWLGSVRGQIVHALGVERFGQSGDIPALYRESGIDTEAVVEAVARACLGR
jgi:pyruvate dehydrogenase E1 component